MVFTFCRDLIGRTNYTLAPGARPRFAHCWRLDFGRAFRRDFQLAMRVLDGEILRQVAEVIGSLCEESGRRFDQ
jgi:hypothetical protein